MNAQFPRLVLLVTFLPMVAFAQKTGNPPPTVPTASADEGQMPGVVASIGAGFEIRDVPEILRKVVIGEGHPIRYRARVESGRPYVVVLGFFETFYERAGQRVMDVRVDGAEPRRVDIAADAGRKVPHAIAITGGDADGDGWLDIVIAPHADAADPNPTVAALWVFAREQWQGRSMSAAQVLAGVFDDGALHRVDCGTERSLRSRLGFEERVARAVTAVSALQAVSRRHAQVAELTHPAIERLTEQTKQLASLHTAAQFDTLALAHGEFTTTLGKTRAAVADTLAREFQPALRQPAQTHLSSPWGALIRVRQEDRLKLQLEILPRPHSIEHKYHPQYARRDPFGWIEIATDATARRDSTALGLSYDLGLQEIAYDPLVTRYCYQQGAVHVGILDVAALRVWSPDLELHLRFNPAKVTREDGLYAGVVGSVHDAEIHYGLMPYQVRESSAADGALACAGFTILWAESAAELRELAAQLSDWERSQQAAADWRQRGTQAGRVTGPDHLTRRADIDRRTFLSMVYQFGGTYAALDGSYEAIWVRDTTNVVVGAALAGDPKYLERWTPYLLANPTPTELDGKRYRTFIIAPYDGEHIFKMEDDGPFYGVLSTYAYWKLCGEDERLGGWYDTLTSAIDFVRAKSYDERLGLYSEALINEAPLKDSPYWKDEKSPALRIGDDWPMRVHSIYVNNLMYGAHLMMAELATSLDKEADAAAHLAEARELAHAIDARLWNTDAGRYWAGLAVMDTGEIIPVDYNYSDIFFDYPWAFSLYTITPHALRDLKSTEGLMRTWLPDPPEDLTRPHVSVPYGHAASIYAWGGEYGRARECVDYLAAVAEMEAYNPTLQAVYAMGGAMFEWNVLVHCHRPQVFAAAPCLQGIVSLGAAVDFNGVSVTPSDQLERIDDLQFKDSTISFDLRSGSRAAGLVVDGQEVPHTLRIPRPLLTSGDHEVRFLTRDDRTPAKPLLVRTNLELRAVRETADETIEYTLCGYGSGIVRLTNVGDYVLAVRNAAGHEVPFDRWPTRTGEWLRINMAGDPVVLTVGK